MIYELDKMRYAQARPLFHRLESWQPMCAAVLEGICPGRVFVDSRHDPTTAFLSTFLAGEEEGVWGFLAGEPANAGFNGALNRALIGREISSRAAMALLTCDPADWGGTIAAVTAPRPPIPMPRRRYVCREPGFDWRAQIPEGFTIQRLEGTLLQQPGLDVPEEVGMTLAKWQSVGDPRFYDFGFVAVHQAAVAAWATVDFVAGSAGEIGFFVQPEYRRCGLAAAVAAAAIEHGLAHSLKSVNWTCSADNAGSIRTAEKLGLQRADDYLMYGFFFNEPQHWRTLASYTLETGRYAEAADQFERAFALSTNQPAWAYFDAARAWAMLENPQKAFRNLSAAAGEGWSDVEGLRGCQELAGLHHLPQWSALMKRLESRRRG